MPGLWRQLRQLWHDYHNFGVKELAALKKYNAEMQVKIEEVRARNRALDKAIEEQMLAALRSEVAQAKAARETMDSDAKQAAFLAEHMSAAARQNVEEDLTERQMAVMQRIMAEAAKMPTSPPEGGEAAGGAAAPDRGGSGSGSERGAGGAA